MHFRRVIYKSIVFCWIVAMPHSKRNSYWEGKMLLYCQTRWTHVKLPIVAIEDAIIGGDALLK